MLTNSVKNEALERLKAVGKPSRKMEPFSYFPFSRYTSTKLSPKREVDPSTVLNCVLPSCEKQRLVFVDGEYSQTLSDMSGVDSKVVVQPFEQAAKVYGPFIKAHLTDQLKKECDPFYLDLFNSDNHGYFIYIPPGVKIDQPIQLISVATGEKSAQKVHVVVGEGAQVDFCAHYIGEGVFEMNHALDWILEKKSRVSLNHFFERVATSFLFSHVRARLREKASFKSFTCSKGAACLRQSFGVKLEGCEADVNLQGTTLLEENAHLHTHVHIDHIVENTTSTQLFKHVQKGNSKSSFDGKIYVEPEAQKTEAYQLTKTLLLEDGPISNSKPNLEIFADDVKASHGATIAQLDEEQLFYLQSRGISEKEAKHLLVKGFVTEQIEQIRDLDLREKMSRFLES